MEIIESVVQSYNGKGIEVQVPASNPTYVRGVN
jgi:hypothetical protein